MMSKAEAKGKLAEMLPPGSEVYTIVRHVSRSGMMRVIDMVFVDREGRIVRVPPYLAEEAGFVYKFDTKQGGWKISGAGMDMGFELVYKLGYLVHGDGYAFTHRWL